MISQHIFLFPFVWESAPHYLKKNTFKEPFQNWNREYFTIQSEKDYNEFVYFYKSVRPVLYGFERPHTIAFTYTSSRLTTDSTCQIYTKHKRYHLPIKNIGLKLYTSGIGILSIQLENTEYAYPEDILFINGLSKTIYPPVLPIEEAVKDYFPVQVEFYLNGKEPIKEKFNKNYYKAPAKVAPFILEILGNPFRENIEPIIGSYMFTVCRYHNPLFLEQIQQKEEMNAYLERFLLLSKKTQEEFSKVHSGRMGIEYLQGEKSLYGMSKYALVYIGDEEGEHYHKLYDQLITLILVQRATLLYLSNRIAQISTLPKAELALEMQNVYETYNQFINQMYFEEVTESVQGQMIYENLLKKLKIPRELEQLEFEMQQMQEYAHLIVQSQSKFKVELLTVIGACLVIPTFATGFFGMNIFQELFYHWWRQEEVLLWLNAYVALPILGFLSLIALGKGKTEKKEGKMIPLVGLLLSLWILFAYGSGLG